MNKIIKITIAMMPVVMFLLAVVETFAQLIHGSMVGFIGFGAIALVLANLFLLSDDDNK
jgi:hypothetical protein